MALDIVKVKNEIYERNNKYKCYLSMFDFFKLYDTVTAFTNIKAKVAAVSAAATACGFSVGRAFDISALRENFACFGYLELGYFTDTQIAAMIAADTITDNTTVFYNDIVEYADKLIFDLTNLKSVFTNAGILTGEYDEIDETVGNVGTSANLFGENPSLADGVKYDTASNTVTHNRVNLTKLYNNYPEYKTIVNRVLYRLNLWGNTVLSRICVFGGEM